MPERQGVWPAFWLLPADGSWPPELDVVEMRGQDPNKLILTAHSNETGSHTTVSAEPYRRGHEASTPMAFCGPRTPWSGISTMSKSRGPHTPADMHKPMYMLVDLAVGGMAGTPADGLATPAEMQIDYIHAYALNDLNIV